MTPKDLENNIPEDRDGEDRVQLLLAFLRTHMANERTFLAWCRAAIALITFGFVVEKFGLFIQFFAPDKRLPGHLTHTKDLMFISVFAFILGGVILVLSGWRFLNVRKMIRRGNVQLSVLPEIMVVISILAIVIMVFLFIVF